MGQFAYLYNTPRWKKLRRLFLSSHPWCEFHKAKGQLVPARIVDHKTPHKGNEVIFWDESEWQALCKPCHDSTKQRLEKSGVEVGCDVNGFPVDPNHPWNKLSA
jgi:5-methylcytosine-specific restriction endonuclease McrA